MNVMSFAHYMTKRTMTLGSGLSYKRLFASALSDAHRYAKRGQLEAKAKEIKAIDSRIANEKMIIRKVVKNAISLGYTVSLFDSEEWTVKRSSNVAEVMEAVQSTEEDTLAFRKDGEHVGSVWLIYGNSASEVMADWTDSEEMSRILAPAIARADKLAEVGL